MKYPNRLRVLRAEKRMNQIETAQAAGIKEYRYWRIESGYDIPTEDEQKQIARALGVTVADLQSQSVTQ